MVVSTPLKNISQTRNLPQIRMNIKNIRNHHLVFVALILNCWTLRILTPQKWLFWGPAPLLCRFKPTSNASSSSAAWPGNIVTCAREKLNSTPDKNWGWSSLRGISFIMGNINIYSLRIQICPKKGISAIFLFWGWDWDHQSYSREGYGSLGTIKGWWPSPFYMAERLDQNPYVTFHEILVGSSGSL